VHSKYVGLAHLAVLLPQPAWNQIHLLLHYPNYLLYLDTKAMDLNKCLNHSKHFSMMDWSHN
jgi:hypothetical protein